MKDAMIMPRSRHRFTIGRFAAMVGAALLLSGCHRAPPASPASAVELPAATVGTAQANARATTDVEEVTGTVEPRLSAQVEAKISGRIAEFPVQLGQHVKRGALLVAIDAAEIDARLAQVVAAERQAQIEFDRTRRLFTGGAATQAEFDAAESRLHEIRAAAAEARAMRAYNRVSAPFDGVVSAKHVDRGDFAMPGKPLLTLDSDQGLRFVADLPAALAGRVAAAGMFDVRIEGVAGSLRASVAEIAPNADPVSRTQRVKLDLPAAEGLASGQFGRLAVPLDAREALLVPTTALITRGQLEMVFVVADGHAQMRLVRAGRQHGDETEILSGLEAGVNVVSEGASGLRDGQPLVTR